MATIDTLSKPAPSAEKLEAALRELLEKHHITGETSLRVSGVVADSLPAYLVTLSSDAAKVLIDELAPILASRTLPSPIEWVIFHSEAIAILAMS